MRALFRRLYRGLQRCVMSEWRDEDLGRSAMVFAPHPDDEVLGCGGTVLRKRRLGADVKIVFVSDGSGSHAGLISAEELRAVRAGEAVSAAEALGVGKGDVELLGLPDGHLAEQEDAGARKVAEVIGRDRPAEVFVPYYQDGPSDHHATTRMVAAALADRRHPATVYEYPVWFWYHWPWTRAEGRGRALLRSLRQGTARTWNMLRDFHCFVRVGDVLPLKRAALERHRSQVERLRPDPAWLTLGDIAGGDFLKCFFQDREIFYRHPAGK